ncbi:MAG: DNA polymerase III subunit alpha [Endomicrobia bacterium]|nr:DNA polymerase III subunit alpha [Endomicrobiia bacterium]
MTFFTHSIYSINKSLLSIEDIVQFYSKHYDFAICTDDNFASFVYFVKTCKEYNLKPIFCLNKNDYILVFLNQEGYKKVVKHYNGSLELKELLNDKDIILLYDLNDHNFYNYRNFNNVYFITENTVFEKNIIYSPRFLYKESDDFFALRLLNLLNKIEFNEVNKHLDEEKLHKFANQTIIREIVERVELKFEQKYYLPLFQDGEQKLRQICYSELTRRNLDNERYRQRLEYELQIIEKMKMSNYFLFVKSITDLAKENNIRLGYGRGSACGSLVVFLCGITEVDPLKYNLIFERFLNPNRVSLPDIDIDIESNKREHLVEICRQKTNLYNIGTQETRGIKFAIRDVSKAMEIDNQEITSKLGLEISKLIQSSVRGRLVKMKDISDNKTIIKYKNLYPTLFEYAEKVENTIRQFGIHASGFVVVTEELKQILPTRQNDKNQIVSEYDMNSLEALGAMKIDLLGLDTLSINEKIKNEAKIKLDVQTLEKSNAYEIFKANRTASIFQFEKMGNILSEVTPKNIEEISILNALNRPGPIDNGMVDDFIEFKKNKKINKYNIDCIDEITKNTAGLIIYQEQIIEIARQFANFSPAEADNLRKIIGKKKQNEIENEREKFISGAIKNGYTEQQAIQVFEIIEKFADYGFNKSHSIAYSLLTLETAFLKKNYEKIFYKHYLNERIKEHDKIIPILREILNSKQLKLIPINFNSPFQFEIENNKIKTGLLLAKGITETQIPIIESLRNINFTFEETSFFSFLEKAYEAKLRKTSIESLIKAGFFDKFTQKNKILFRYKLLLFLEHAWQSLKSSQKIDKSLINSMLQYKYSYSVTKDILEQEANTLGIATKISYQNLFSKILSEIKDSDRTPCIVSKVEQINNYYRLTLQDKYFNEIKCFSKYKYEEFDLILCKFEHTKGKTKLKESRKVNFYLYIESNNDKIIDILQENIGLTYKVVLNNKTLPFKIDLSCYLTSFLNQNKVKYHLVIDNKKQRII